MFRAADTGRNRCDSGSFKSKKGRTFQWVEGKVRYNWI